MKRFWLLSLTLLILASAGCTAVALPQGLAGSPDQAPTLAPAQVASATSLPAARASSSKPGPAAAKPPRATPTARAASSAGASAPVGTQSQSSVSTLPQASAGTLSQAPVVGTQPQAPQAAVNSGPYQPYQLETLALFSAALDGAERVAQIYLPGEYAQNPSKRYPVLYAFDGQQLPEIDFAAQLDQLVEAGKIQPVIVVAVYSTEGDLRKEELGAGAALNMLGWGTQSAAFNRFVVGELLPKVNSTYRILAGPAHTGVMGWSLGGLAAFYVAWQNPGAFGLVGAFSPSFWWRTLNSPEQEQDPSGAAQLAARVIPSLVVSSPKHAGMRMWFEAGTAEQPYSDVDHNGVIDMIQDVQDTMVQLSLKGYQAGADMVFRQVEGGQHELATWQTVMPEFLQFAFAK